MLSTILVRYKIYDGSLIHCLICRCNDLGEWSLMEDDDMKIRLIEPWLHDH